MTEMILLNFNSLFLFWGWTAVWVLCLCYVMGAVWIHEQIYISPDGRPVAPIEHVGLGSSTSSSMNLPIPQRAWMSRESLIMLESWFLYVRKFWPIMVLLLKIICLSSIVSSSPQNRFKDEPEGRFRVVVGFSKAISWAAQGSRLRGAWVV